MEGGRGGIIGTFFGIIIVQMIESIIVAVLMRGRKQELIQKMPGKVLITSVPFNAFAEAAAMLETAGLEIVRCIKPNAEECGPADFGGTMPGVHAVVAGMERWNEAMFRCFPDLEIIARYGVGYDKIDLAAAKEHGVRVTNTRVAELSQSVAEGALLLTLAALRHLPMLTGNMKQGIWRGQTGASLFGKTVGILGFGAIGQSFAKLLRGFETKILVCDPFIAQSVVDQHHATPVSQDTLLAESDIVSVHAPGTPENRHLIRAETLGGMKPTAILVNTSRGALVDEKALYEALTSGRLAGAALDVWETEPTPPDTPLLSLNNVVSLPHVAGDTRECVAAMVDCCVRQVTDALSGKQPRYVLNMEEQNP